MASASTPRPSRTALTHTTFTHPVLPPARLRSAVANRNSTLLPPHLISSKSSSTSTSTSTSTRPLPLPVQQASSKLPAKTVTNHNKRAIDDRDQQDSIPTPPATAPFIDLTMSSASKSSLPPPPPAAELQPPTPPTKRPRKAATTAVESRPPPPPLFNPVAGPSNSATKTANNSASKSAALLESKKKAQADLLAWKKKYKNAFPSFVFYFDSLDATTELRFINAVEKLGATIDNFFSKKVTIVVTSRAVPTSTNKENAGSKSTPAASPSGVGPIRNAGTNANLKKDIYKKLALDRSQKLRPDSTGPFYDQDILSKAIDMGCRVWRTDKLQSILERLSSYSPSKTASAARRKLSLPSLLRDEQLYGTRERDPFVPRPDTHYFPSHIRYILVEDTTGGHRPIIIKEYPDPPAHVDPEWPVLWGGVEGRSGFHHYQGSEKIKYERRLPPPPVTLLPQAPPRRPTTTNPGYAVAAARAVAGNSNNPVAPNLRRAVSLNRITQNAGPQPQHPHHHKPGSYLAVSGNSMPMTSNIASATSTSVVPGFAGGANNGAFRAKQMEIMNRNSVSIGGIKRVGDAMPGKLKRSVSVDAGLNSKAPPPRDEPKKPGYCENCRVKYEDFREHCVSRRHRKFAMNDDNWKDLDELLQSIERPFAPTPESDGEESENGEEEDEEGEVEEETGEDAEGIEGDSGFFEGTDGCHDEEAESDEQDEQEDSEGGASEC